jgi:plasmid stabilization system protein ParE
VAWTVEDADEIASDLAAIADHLVDAHLGHGHSFDEALALARRRIDAILDGRSRLGAAPRRGTRHVLEGNEYRHATMDRAIYWFTLDEAAQVVRVLGIFHGGQDHLGRMLARLTAEGGG